MLDPQRENKAISMRDMTTCNNSTCFQFCTHIYGLCLRPQAATTMFAEPTPPTWCSCDTEAVPEDSSTDSSHHTKHKYHYTSGKTPAIPPVQVKQGIQQQCCCCRSG
jgi:hypothetical protein